MAKTTEPSIKNWEKVYVIAGEPCVSRLTLADLIKDCKSIKRIYKKDDLSNLKNKISTLSVLPQIFVFYDPNADILKIIYECLESNRVACDKLIMFINGDDYDGRITFYSKAQKNKRMFFADYIELNQTNELIKYIQGWSEEKNIKIDSDALQWLIKNAPVTFEKIRSGNTKKETEVYDLPILESELDKLVSLAQLNNRSINFKDVSEFCLFDQVTDVWTFIKYAIEKNYKHSFRVIDKIKETQDVNSIMWLLHSQLAFLIQLKDFVNRGIFDANLLADKMNYKQYLNKFYDDDWEIVENISEPNINPWRVKKALELLDNLNLESMIDQFNTITESILRTRNGVSNDVAFEHMLVSLLK